MVLPACPTASCSGEEAAINNCVKLFWINLAVRPPLMLVGADSTKLSSVEKKPQKKERKQISDKIRLVSISFSTSHRTATSRTRLKYSFLASSWIAWRKFTIKITLFIMPFRLILLIKVIHCHFSPICFGNVTSSHVVTVTQNHIPSQQALMCSNQVYKLSPCLP